MLEAPNGEIILAYHTVVSNWGILGTYEWIMNIDSFSFDIPGAYHWQLFHGEKLLLSRPMLVKFEE